MLQEILSPTRFSELSNKASQEFKTPLDENTIPIGRVVYRDSGLETAENLKKYYIKNLKTGASGRIANTFKCKLCSKTMRQFCNMKSHIRMHLDLKPYACSLCGKSFTTSSNCKTHLRTRACLKYSS